jgi:hypothetical protein
MDSETGRKLWVEHWQRVGPLLEQVRRDELRALSDEQSARQLETLSEFALDAPQLRTRTTSGFVEQQRLFLKLAQHGSAR